jgi:hypothetical protein
MTHKITSRSLAAPDTSNLLESCLMLILILRTAYTYICKINSIHEFGVYFRSIDPRSTVFRFGRIVLVRSIPSSIYIHRRNNELTIACWPVGGFQILLNHAYLPQLELYTTHIEVETRHLLH